jgi:sn-glycerol 3-phosphate transport system permease protein|tara:strand:- start:708 stop:1535 length:828 start_codon:yes stop_codon:yes gene_type:complete
MESKYSQFTAHVILILGILIMILPIWIIFASSTHDNLTLATKGLQFGLGDSLFNNYNNVIFTRGGFSKEITLLKLFSNSFIMALGIATFTVITSLLAAYTIVYFKVKLATTYFWLIFLTILVPLEVRILPSHQIVSELNLINTYAGLILPLLASAIATLFFRQFYKTIPEELLEAAKLDGVTSFKFLIDFIIPLSKTMIIAIFIFMFVYGYNQYLWPIIATTNENYWTVIMGMKIIFMRSLVTSFSYIILSIIPPILVIILLQRWFVKGLIHTEK